MSDLSKKVIKYAKKYDGDMVEMVCDEFNETDDAIMLKLAREVEHLQERVDFLRKDSLTFAQFVSDRDKEIERLQKYEQLVKFISHDYIELSQDKTAWQRDDWRKRCMKLIEKDKK